MSAHVLRVAAAVGAVGVVAAAAWHLGAAKQSDVSARACTRSIAEAVSAQQAEDAAAQRPVIQSFTAASRTLSSTATTTLTWTSRNATHVEFSCSPDACPSGVSFADVTWTPAFDGGTAALSTSSVHSSFSVTLTARNAWTGEETTSTLSFNVTCIHENVLLSTRSGPCRAGDVSVGTEMLQPDGSFSRVLRVVESTLAKGNLPHDRRLFADASGRVVVTPMHALAFGSAADALGSRMVPACLHDAMEEVVAPALPTRVNHFELEHPAHVLGVAHTDAWLESLVEGVSKGAL